MRLQDWIDEWKQTNQLPVMVKVTLKMAADQYSSQVREQLTRIVSLPSVAVQPGWQVPRVMGLQPNQQLVPGQQPIPGQQPLPGQNLQQPFPVQQQPFPGQQPYPGMRPTPNQ